LPLLAPIALPVILIGLLVGKPPGAAEPGLGGQEKPAAASGSITGTVRSSLGAALAGAKLSLVAEPDASPSAVAAPAALTGVPTVMNAVTDARGSFAFNAVAPGIYTIEAESAGFQKSSRLHVLVTDGAATIVDFTLEAGKAGVPYAPPTGQPPDTKVAKASGAQALAGEGFNYDASAQFKASAVNAAVDPGGYSAAKEIDSYALMLDYVQSQAIPSELESRGARAMEGQGQAQAASSLPPTATELGTWNESQFLARGSNLLVNRNVAGSIELFRAGLARFPNAARLATGLGIALSARGVYEEAIESLIRATDLAPSDPRPYLVLAKAYLASPKPDGEVLKRLALLVTLDPKDPQAPYYYALALAKEGPEGAGANRGDATKIESLLRDALTLDPTFAEAHLQLGILLATQSSYRDAIREYQSAARLKPSLAAAHYRLAQAYNRIGDKAAAEKELAVYQQVRQAESTSVPPAHE